MNQPHPSADPPSFDLTASQPPIPAGYHSAEDSSAVGSRELHARLRLIYNRVRWLLWIRAASWTIIWLVIVVQLGMAIDWWLRPSSSLARTMLSSALLSAIAAVALGCWYVFWRRPLTLAAVARRIEMVLPAMGDRISSIVAILEKDGPQSSLEREAVRQTSQQLAEAKPEKAIDHRPTVQSFITAVVIIVLVTIFSLWRPGFAATAIQRLVGPANATTWPQQDQLVFANLPDRVHSGSDIEWFVRNLRGSLPEDTEVFIRLLKDGERDSDNDDVAEVSQLPFTMAGDFGALKWDDVQSSFAVRARGGDDDTMPWQRVEVITAPTIESFQVRLQPPSYSQRSALTVVESRLQVLAGTQMWIEAVVKPAVTAARLSTSDAFESQLAAEDASADGTATLDDNGERLRVGPIELKESGTWRFVWRDLQGMQGISQQAWQVQVEDDTAPIVDLLRPERDLEVSAQANLDLLYHSEDDLGLVAAWLQGVHVESSSELMWDQQQFTDQRLTIDAATNISLGSMGLELSPGDTLEVTALARDTMGQVGRSTTRRLRIVTSQRIAETIATLAQEASDRIQDARQQQQVALEQTEAASSRLGDDAEQRQATIDRLRSANVAQQATRRALTGELASALSALDQAQANARQNQMDSSASDELREQIQSLVDMPLSAAEAGLEQSLDDVANAAVEAASSTIDETIDRQRSVLERLNQLANRIQQNDQQAQLQRQLAELSAAQQRLLDETNLLDEATDAQTQQDRLATRQRELARQADDLLQQLDQLAQQQTTSDPAAAQRAEATAETLRGESSSSTAENSRSLAETMRSAADELQQGRTGTADQQQRQAQSQIDRARQQLSQDNQRILPEDQQTPLRQFVAATEQLVDRQRQLNGELDTKLDDTWSRRQQELADQTRQVVQQVTAPPGFAETLQDAASDMDLAAAYAQRSSSVAQVPPLAEAALARLELILESLAPSTKAPSDQPAGAGEEGADADQPPQTPLPRESLKLARALQQFLKERTAQLQAEAEQIEQFGSDPITAARNQTQRRAVAEEQSRLIERIEQVLQSQLSERASDTANSDTSISDSAKEDQP